MDSPNKGWHEAIFHGEDIKELDNGFEACCPDLLKWYNFRYSGGAMEIETPESIALTIGSHAENTHTEHLESALPNKDGTKRELAKGYIGAKTIEEAD
jgi:uncharacterized protein YajQ (UPF0234 family)